MLETLELVFDDGTNPTIHPAPTLPSRRLPPDCRLGHPEAPDIS